MDNISYPWKYLDLNAWGQITPDGQYYIYQNENDSRKTYKKSVSEEWTGYGRLTKNWLWSYLLTFDNGQKEYFMNEGRLTKIENRTGNSITFEYGTDGKLESIFDTLGREISVNYSGERISQITDFNGR